MLTILHLNRSKSMKLKNYQFLHWRESNMKLAKQRKISIFNMKGGLGKSTIAAYLAHAFALLGYPTLLIECDMQKNASSILPEPPTHTLTDVLTERVPLKQAIY